MIDDQAVIEMIRTAMPDAQVVVRDLTGTRDHLDVKIRSKAFAGKSVLDQHRMVYSVLEPARLDGRIHALQLKTEIAL